MCLAVRNETARRVGIAICKGDHSAWWWGWPLVSFADRLNDGSFSVCPYASLARACCPCNSLSHVECGWAFCDIALNGFKVFISCPGGYISYTVSLHYSVLVPYNWVFSIFILLLCQLFLSTTAAGRKLLHANCADFVSQRHSQLALRCRRRLSKIGWGKAEHIFTVVIKAQWRDFSLQLYVNWQLLLVPASASYGQTQ